MGKTKIPFLKSLKMYALERHKLNFLFWHLMHLVNLNNYLTSESQFIKIHDGTNTILLTDLL